MGCSLSAERDQWQGYDHHLFQDEYPQSFRVPGSDSKGATAILRSLKAKDGFSGFLKDDEGVTKNGELDNALSSIFISFVFMSDDMECLPSLPKKTKDGVSLPRPSKRTGIFHLLDFDLSKMQKIHRSVAIMFL